MTELFSDAPDGYVCPICTLAMGADNKGNWAKRSDVFFQDETVMGFISSKAIHGNEGHALIVPVRHFENLYNLPDSLLDDLGRLTQRIAVAMLECRNCAGVNIVQNNGKAAGQHAFHYHTHVIPRFIDDDCNVQSHMAELCSPESRMQYATDLREHLRHFNL